MTTRDDISLTQAIRAMLPQGVGLALCDIDAPHPPLWQGEEEAIRRAIPARVREFTAGRAAARLAMADAGLPPGLVMTAQGRAPEWPAGLSGSITHTARVAAAIVARRQDWPGVGLDLEDARPMDHDTADLIRHPMDQVDPSLPAALAATLIFSAKEAAFKAQFPLTGLWIDYREVALRVAGDGFSVNVRGVPLTGRWRLAQGLFGATVLIGPDQAVALRRAG